MKQNGVWFVCLVLAGLLAVFPAFAQKASTTNYESHLVDTFDAPEALDWVWSAQASRFVASGYPKIQYFNGAPMGLRTPSGENKTESKVLGAEVRFERKGDNWMEIFPSKKGDDGKVIPFEPDFIGTVDSIDLWVWGTNYSYKLELMLRDGDGKAHTLPVTRTLFDGWQHFSVKIPQTIPQHSRYRSGRGNMTFIGFRVTTDSWAPVDKFVIYFDHLKYLTNTFYNFFDGAELGPKTFDGEGVAQ